MPMDVQFPQFADPNAALAAGIGQGVDFGSKIAQVAHQASQRRAQEWDQAASKAKLGFQLLNDPNQAESVRLAAGNKFVAPFINDPRWGLKDPSGKPLSFTAADLEDPALTSAVEGISKIMADPEIPDKSRFPLARAKLMEYHAKRGEGPEVDKLLETIHTDASGKGKVTIIGPDGLPYVVDKETNTASPIPLPTSAATPTPGQRTRVNGDKSIYAIEDLNDTNLVTPTERKNIQSVLDDVQSKVTPIQTDAQKDLGQINQIKALVNSKNPAATGLIKTLMIRVVGKDNKISDTDIKQNGGDPSLQARANRALEKITTGQLTDADRTDLDSLLSLTQQMISGAAKKNIQSVGASYRARLPKRFDDKLYQSILLGAAPASGKPAAGGKGAGAAYAEKIKAAQGGQ